MSVSAEQVREAIKDARWCMDYYPPSERPVTSVTLLRYITELVRVARRAKVLLKKEWLGTQLQEDIDAALAKYKEVDR